MAPQGDGGCGRFVGAAALRGCGALRARGAGGWYCWGRRWFLQGDGLGYVGVGGGRDADGLVVWGVAGGEHQDRQGGGAAHIRPILKNDT